MKGRGTILAVALAWALTGCGGAPPVVTSLPQEAGYYADSAQAAGLKLDPAYQKEQTGNFLAMLLEPWLLPPEPGLPPTVSQSFQSFRAQPGFGENLKPRSPAWAEDLLLKANLEMYPSANFPAISLVASDLRALPTHLPVFWSAEPGGNGYPFDRVQLSQIPAQTPLYVLHHTREGAWALVSCHYGLGWMPARDLARLEQDQIKAWQKGRYVALTSDRAAIKDAGGRLLCLAGLGSVLPLVGEDYAEYRVLAASSDGQGKAQFHTVRLSKTQAAAMPLALTPANLTHLMDPLLGQPYGWGGYLGNRDCSGLLKDLFTPFGIWLPRNSAQQARAGHAYVELKDASASGKQRLISEFGLPYMSLLWMPGHIMLYLGSHEKQPVALHSVWGAGEAKGDSRPARVIISSLSSADQGGEALLKRLESMVLLVPPERLAQ